MGMALKKSDCAGGSCAAPVLAGALGGPALGYKPTGKGVASPVVRLIVILTIAEAWRCAIFQLQSFRSSYGRTSHFSLLAQREVTKRNTPRQSAFRASATAPCVALPPASMPSPALQVP